MHTREFNEDGRRTVVVVLDPGDEPISALTAVAREFDLDAAHFTAIGAFQSATIGWFDLARRDYRRNLVDEQVEVVSLVGDITRANLTGDELTVHAHVVLARSDGQALGGHLLEASVQPTLEVVITEASGRLRRRHDEATGLALIDLEASSTDADATTLRGDGDVPDRP